MTIKFFEDHKYITTWEDYSYVPSKGDKVILKLYPQVKDDEISWVDFPLSPEENAKKFVYRIQERQWHENELVVLVVEKLD